MLKRRAAAAVVFMILLAGTVGGCSKSRQTEQHDTRFSTVYAELMLLHEQEKSTPNTPDSLYQVHVRALFNSYGMTEDDFRKRSAELMKDDETWRAFLADVSMVFDSLKTARRQHPK
ncbi:MAG TPA: hypothetical protein VK470_06545 [Bacteroidota bacterium]|nr:hypothetical protein [Bacteroidota bacterium]